MTRALLIASIAVSAPACGAQEFTEAQRLGGVDVPAVTLNRGRQQFNRYCASCHGADGKAQTAAARALTPRPRDLAAGEFKHKSTMGAALPTDDDLKRTIRGGVPGTGMPASVQLDDRDLDAVVQYIKVFSKRWKDVRTPGSEGSAKRLPAPDTTDSVRPALLMGNAAGPTTREAALAGAALSLTTIDWRCP